MNNNNNVVGYCYNDSNNNSKRELYTARFQFPPLIKRSERFNVA